MTTEKVVAVLGDITAQQADCLITFANPSGSWQGGIDKALYRRYGQVFHDQLRTHLREGNFANGDIVTTTSADAPYAVMFVCDDFYEPLPLKELLSRALVCASEMGFQSLTMPVFRTGLVAALFNPFQMEAELISAIKESSFEGTVTIVVYGDQEQFSRLQALISA